MCDLYIELDITRSHSRPRVSNDNPYSEAGVKTLKYRPGFPARFDTLQAAQSHCEEFFDWYNHHHRHQGIAMLTPAQHHFGHADAVIDGRQRVMEEAMAVNPARFTVPCVIRAPKPQVWINQPPDKETDTTQ